MMAETSPEKYDEIEDALREVVDPELDVNIVDLGLVYDLSFDEDGELVISMTLTSAGCPLTDVLEEQITASLKDVVPSFRINWVWMPPWGPERITPEGRDMMRALGFTI
ncbi:metal-sulfur cluster assembly factor [Pseudoclavibacter sp. 13-3]|nr:metal-sulfur cluster assembly factor [Pseudoclavibacter sp. 13-3]MCD7101919.1 metal-sulfur cluster assembly factor [Pseudoclavibacter sp. 13-3]